MTEALSIQVASEIISGFDRYLSDFREITRRAHTHFEGRDWHGIQADSKRRLLLYKRQVPQIARKVRRLLGPAYQDVEAWTAVKAVYAGLARDRSAYEIAETFYNSVCRKVIGDIGADRLSMFVLDEHSRREYESQGNVYRSYPWEGAPSLRQMLADFQLPVTFEDIERDIIYILQRMEEDIFSEQRPGATARLDMVRSVFYRNKAAYLVGRFVSGSHTFPFVLPILHQTHGAFVDTLITDQDTVSIIFSFTRSYFLVEADHPSELVHFLRSILPLKSYSDLYNSIGYSKHGKTELYRHFLHHLEHSEDPLVIAPGIRGMVMAVFTLSSYNIVFKLIKDRFDPPKTMNKAHVKSRYKMVSMHDRVGRMADTHEFEHFILPKDRFDPALLEELLRVAPSIVHVEGDRVCIDHLYTERKMVPLNIFLDTATPEEAEAVIDEYGNTIKQLAAANIFPGDMLLKNFGVTRHGRVVFYDYDEIGFLTDYRFRRMPEPVDDDDMYAGSPWFAVSPNDVFPEEFKHFLVGREDIREIFFRRHMELFEPRFWIDMQQKQINGEIVDVFPYRRRLRFEARADQ
ncbi:MAG: bifunctional isocitrate dehydrogenase kinase/phosphatase [Bacteroidetes bacterium]|nr:MAG: bifunctional isocitrate dehydrogenase kinase/phosphatase [Bacteroidota bacterium]